MSTTPIHAQNEMDFTGLCSTLEALILAHQQLQTCLQEEKRTIITGDVEGLGRCGQDKEAALVRIAELERARMDSLQSFGDSENKPTLKSLIPLCPPPHRERLQSSQLRLDALLSSIQEINQMNGMLVGRVLGQISGLLDVLRHLSPAGPVYQQNGIVNVSPTGGRTFGKR